MFSGPLIADEQMAIQVLPEENVIKVEHLNAIENILDIFGCVIYSILVDFQEIDSNDGKQIVEYINDQCSDTLEKIQLLNCKSSVLDRLRNEFKYMNEVKFSSSVSECLIFDRDDHQMSNIFPTLNSLHVHHTTPSDWTFIKGKFEQLRVLDVHLPQTIRDDTINGWHISSLFMNNQRIRDLTIVNPTLKLLKVVNEKLRQLESLNIVGLSDNYLSILNKPFQFRPLQQLMLHPNHENQIPRKINFPKLKELTLQIERNLTSKWMRFVSERIDSNLVELNLQTQELAREYFDAIPSIWPGLNEVNISCQSEFTANNVLNFMDESKELTSFKLEIRIDQLENKRLVQQLDNMWTMKHYNRSVHRNTVAMSFQR